MKSLRRITSAVLVALLVIVAGLSSTGHAMSKGCMVGHFDDQMVVLHPTHGVNQAPLEETSPASWPASNDTDHDGCNPLLCNAHALTPQASVARCASFETVLAWQVVHVHAPEHAETPDRPPNI